MTGVSFDLSERRARSRRATRLSGNAALDAAERAATHGQVDGATDREVRADEVLPDLRRHVGLGRGLDLGDAWTVCSTVLRRADVEDRAPAPAVRGVSG